MIFFKTIYNEGQNNQHKKRLNPEINTLKLYNLFFNLNTKHALFNFHMCII